MSVREVKMPEDNEEPTSEFFDANKLDESDLEYHKFIVKQQAALPSYQQQINGIQRRMQDTIGSVRMWEMYTNEKYGLRDGLDILNEHGEIRRAPKDAE